MFDELTVSSELHDLALDCLTAGIQAAKPETVVKDGVSITEELLHIGESEYDLSNYNRIIVVGGGNAAGHVAAELESILGKRIDGGVVITDEITNTAKIEIRSGSHPIPGKKNIKNTRRLIEFVETADEHTLVLSVIGGGGSALMSAPAGEVALEDLQTTTKRLLNSGAEISEINAVRKHLSDVKGGQLARSAAPATVVGIILSDVIGNEMSVIASGPTAPDSSTYADALSILERYNVETPENARHHLQRGFHGDLVETPNADDPLFHRIENHIFADAYTAIDAAREVAMERGYDTVVLSTSVRGEATESAKTHVAIAEEVRATGNPSSAPIVLLSGGETTVTVQGNGTGGPNQEFALCSAIELNDGRTIIGSIDTDGYDGSTDAAGAIITDNTVDDQKVARAALNENDAYSYLDEQGVLLQSGATGTNVNDLRIIIIDE